MSKTRVAFFVEMMTEDLDGCIRTVHQIIQRIPEDRFEFIFITGVMPQEELDWEIKKLPSIDLLINRPYRMVWSMDYKSQIKQILDDFQPDVIHYTSPSLMASYALSYGKKHQIPVSTIYHTHFVSYTDYYLRNIPFMIPVMRKLLVAITRPIYDDCDVVFVPTQVMIDELNQYGLRTDHYVLWQRGLNHAVFHPGRRQEGYFKSLTGNDGPVIFFASRLVWEKNLETLIKVYELSEERGLGYNFVLAGTGKADEAVKARMPNAHFTGNVSHDQLATMYASADVFLFPSDTETYGNVVVEAMASGLPCVIANGGGSRSFIEHGKSGFLCSVHDAEDYLQSIQRIIDEPDLRQQFIEEGIKVAAPLSWNALAKRYFDYVEGLGQGRSVTEEVS